MNSNTLEGYFERPFCFGFCTLELKYCDGLHSQFFSKAEGCDGIAAIHWALYL